MNKYTNGDKVAKYIFSTF